MLDCRINGVMFFSNTTTLHYSNIPLLQSSNNANLETPRLTQEESRRVER